MITVTLKSQCTISGLVDAGISKAIIKALSVANPDYVKAKRQGRPCWMYPETVCLAETQDDGTITIPREAWKEIRDLFDDEAVELRDERLQFPQISFGASRIPPWDHQAVAIRLVSRIGGGVIEVPCGGGKTNIGLSIVSALQQPTLWLVHKLDLIDQSEKRARSMLCLDTEDIGIIARGEVHVGRKITFATVQTLAEQDPGTLRGLSRMFGLVLVDECHHVFETPTAVTQFAKVINNFPAYHRVGITATARRQDGLEVTMNWLLGRTVFSLPHDVLYDQGYIIKPLVKKVYTQFEYVQDDGRTLNFNAMIEKMIGDDDRNAVLLSLIKAQAFFSHVLVLSSRVDHVTDLHGWLTHMVPEYAPELVHGGTKMAERERIYSAVRGGACRILVATYELAKEGLDMPILDALVFATPMKNPTMIEQACGRIMRAHEGKDGATVWDVVDRRVKACRNQFNERRKVYTKLQCRIEEVGK